MLLVVNHEGIIFHCKDEYSPSPQTNALQPCFCTVTGCDLTHSTPNRGLQLGQKGTSIVGFSVLNHQVNISPSPRVDNSDHLFSKSLLVQGKRELKVIYADQPAPLLGGRPGKTDQPVMGISGWGYSSFLCFARRMHETPCPGRGRSLESQATSSTRTLKEQISMWRRRSRPSVCQNR